MGDDKGMGNRRPAGWRLAGYRSKTGVLWLQIQVPRLPCCSQKIADQQPPAPHPTGSLARQAAGGAQRTEQQAQPTAGIAHRRIPQQAQRTAAHHTAGVA